MQLTYLDTTVTLTAGETVLKGRFLKPGTYSPYINGKPARVRVSKETILAAWPKLVERVKQGGAEIRLNHPGLGDVSLKWGRIMGLGLDPTKGEVYISRGVPNPAILEAMDDEAWRSILNQEWSIRSQVKLAPTDEPDTYDLTDFADFQGVDIVNAGAFTGSSITPTLPAGLVARLAAAAATPRAASFSKSSPPGDCGWLAAEQTPGEPMPRLETVEQIPEEVRAKLGSPELDQAYLTKYNTLVESGLDPVAASQQAIEAVLNPTTTPDASAPMTAALATLKAQKADLERRLAETTAQLQAKTVELSSKDKTVEALTGRLTAAESQTKTLTEWKAQMEAAAAKRDAEDDVKAALHAGKCTPAMKEDDLLIRQTLGRDAYNKMLAKRPLLVPIGEKGHAEPQTSDPDAARAEQLLAKYGVEKVLRMGFHKTTPGMAPLLMGRHADDPEVKRHVAPLVPKAGDA